jgi:hypothetical protein
MKSFYIIVALLVMGAIAPAATAKSRVRELGHEASPSMIRLPASENGELTMQACDTCKVRRLRASPATVYEIGDQPVTLAELTTYLAKNPKSGLLVVQRNGTSELVRIEVDVPKKPK